LFSQSIRQSTARAAAEDSYGFSIIGKPRLIEGSMPMNPRILIALMLFAGTWAVDVMDLPFRSLWPSLLALLLVFLLRSALAGLLAGALAGALLLAGGNPYAAVIRFVEVHLTGSLQSAWNIRVLVFTMLMGGFVGIIEAGGGLQGLVRRFLGDGKPQAKRVLWSSVGMGLVCFFDGLANSLMVGRVMRPLADKAGVAREKLAYVVDSTSSPIACIALISTWSATQLALIKAGLDQVGAAGNPYLLFLESIPYNFYCWFTLLLVFLVIARNFDVGPMRKAQPHPAEDQAEQIQSAPAYQALVPLATLIALILAGLYISGSDRLFPSSLQDLAMGFGRSKTDLVLVCASALACVVAAILNRRSIQSSIGEVFMRGVTSLLVPALILVAAWCLTSTLNALGAKDTLTGMLQGRLSPHMLPVAVFFTGAMTSFFTGTSWGTMAVLMPLSVPLAFTIGGDLPPDVVHHLLVSVIAAVFSGAVFGDHCSPISDTTLVSSVACDVQPMDHVQAQLPYALIAAVLAAAAGFIPAGFGLPAWMGLLLGAAVLTGLTQWAKIRG
jgi:tetracycline resistance efflux pump